MKKIRTINTVDPNKVKEDGMHTSLGPPLG